MKNKILALTAILALTLGIVAGCGKSADSSSESKSQDTVQASEENKELETIKVGAGVTPHAEILNQVKEKLAEKGYNLEIVEYNDYVLPNTALEDGDLDANYFQHKPYLDDFNAENGTHIVGVANVHFEPLGIYAGKTASLDELQKGAIVAVPNDTTNEARALLLLEQEGLIKLKEDAGLQATVLDIEENPLNLEIKELEAAQVARAINDVDIACINGNYAIEAELDEAIALESAKSEAAQTYANLIAVREGEEDSEKTKAFVEAVLSDEVRDYINDNYEGAVVPVF
ncbi:MAG: MetQ/NlpA family ABC transporter substrate-binding protein [Lachnospiraceae bacterium]|nr:MetQ/NlpA family ABC transporter substrate-binding protein [Lachnospiraceae bacterium]